MQSFDKFKLTVQLRISDYFLGVREKVGDQNLKPKNQLLIFFHFLRFFQKNGSKKCFKLFY